MNPSWVSAISVIAGFAVQIVWTVFNARMSAANSKMTAAMTEQFALMERRIARAYVSERTCRERMNLPALPMVEVQP
jgi:hypothetical protein